jgi:hypothetical protein
MASTPTFPGVPPVQGGATLQNSDGAAAYKDLYTAPSGASDKGVLMGRLRAVSDDTAAVNVRFAIKVGATDYPLGVVQIPAGAGDTAGVAWKDILADLNVGEALELAPGAILRARALVAVTAAKTVTFFWTNAPLA